MQIRYISKKYLGVSVSDMYPILTLPYMKYICFIVDNKLKHLLLNFIQEAAFADSLHVGIDYREIRTTT